MKTYYTRRHETTDSRGLPLVIETQHECRRKEYAIRLVIDNNRWRRDKVAIEHGLRERRRQWIEETKKAMGE